jgi:hypothetical protein
MSYINEGYLIQVPSGAHYYLHTGILLLKTAVPFFRRTTHLFDTLTRESTLYQGRTDTIACHCQSGSHLLTHQGPGRCLPGVHCPLTVNVVGALTQVAVTDPT